MLYSGAKGTMTPNNRLQRTALRAAADAERYEVARIPLMRRARLASASPPFPTLAAAAFGHPPFLLMG